jgi:thioredoxin-related protein
MVTAPSRCYAAVVVSFVLIAGAAPAQEVQWRTDYDAARREARDTHRPLVLDFGTAACVWCQRLDADTFRDPAVVRSLNEQFIPVKVDGNRHPDLVRALKIQGFPTLVFATPDGRILEAHEGFMDAARFGQQLRLTLDAAAPPRHQVPAKDLLTRARDDYRDGLYQGCREKCAALAAAYPSAPEATEAQALAARTRGDTAQAARPTQGPTIRAQAP